MDGVAASARGRLPVQDFSGTPKEIARQWYEARRQHASAHVADARRLGREPMVLLLRSRGGAE
jgi:hypothetical protein